jgi:hypothetical protein
MIFENYATYYRNIVGWNAMVLLEELTSRNPVLHRVLLDILFERITTVRHWMDSATQTDYENAGILKEEFEQFSDHLLHEIRVLEAEVELAYLVIQASSFSTAGFAFVCEFIQKSEYRFIYDFYTATLPSDPWDIFLTLHSMITDERSSFSSFLPGYPSTLIRLWETMTHSR